MTFLNLSTSPTGSLIPPLFLPQGLSSLNFLDLSYNKLMTLSQDCLAPLVTLRVLRLQGNRLTVSVVAALQGLRSVTDLDLSHNLLAGPLGPSTVPR